MLGTYRLCLAVCVALSHIGVQIHGLNPGVIAVVRFYLVSGYVMTGLLRTHYFEPRGITGFYADRALRLLPHYLVIVFVTLAWFVSTGNHTEYLRRDPGILDIVENLLIVPMNYYMFNRSDDFALVPPSWSLGAEVQFYLVLPFILLFSRSVVRGLALLLSIAVYACAALGLINSDWFGYRLLPGVLFMFLIGSMLYDLHHSKSHGHRATILVGVMIVSAGLFASALAHVGKLGSPYNRETLIGLVVGLVAVNTLACRARHRIDDALGNLSYGVFLNHFLVQWMLFDGKIATFGAVVAYIAASLAIAALLYWIVERPVLDVRRRLRGSPSARFAPRQVTASLSLARGPSHRSPTDT